MAENISRFYLKDGQEISLNSKIFSAVQNNTIPFEKRITKAGDRLDYIAYEFYQNAQLWWIIAAASGIGWWLQVSDGIVLKIPLDLEDIKNLKENN